MVAGQQVAGRVPLLIGQNIENTCFEEFPF